VSVLVVSSGGGFAVVSPGSEAPLVEADEGSTVVGFAVVGFGPLLLSDAVPEGSGAVVEDSPEPSSPAVVPVVAHASARPASRGSSS
jgi:hypothetical protein